MIYWIHEIYVTICMLNILLDLRSYQNLILYYQLITLLQLSKAKICMKLTIFQTQVDMYGNIISKINQL